jgi:hypothetical protein
MIGIGIGIGNKLALLAAMPFRAHLGVRAVAVARRWNTHSFLFASVFALVFGIGGDDKSHRK